MKVVHSTAFVLLVIGGLNWLFVAFGWNLVHAIFGSWPMVETFIYFIVGLAAIWEAIMHPKNCKLCSAGKAQPMQPIQK